MNVLQLISSRGLFGAENMLLELSKGLKSLGDSVTLGVFSNRHAGAGGALELTGAAGAVGIRSEVFECSSRVDFATIRKIRSFIKENSIDVVHSHGYKSNIYAYLACTKTGARLVTTCHNWINASSKMSLYTRLDKFFLKRFDAVAAVSDDVARQALEAGVKPEKLRIIGNGISIEKFRVSGGAREKTRRALGVPAGASVIGTVGRLSPEKGYDLLLKAAREVCGKKDDCFFVIAGDGPQRQPLEELSRELGTDKRVVFAGKRTDIPEVLSAMDLFVLSSLTEGQPMALLEAMAAGVPAVSTSVGDVPKILRNGEAGLIVPPSDCKALAGAILKALDDPELAARLSASAMRTVKELYSSERMAAEYRACYKG